MLVPIFPVACCLSPCTCFPVACAQDVYKQADCSGNAVGKLAEEGIAGVNINSFAIVGEQQAAFLWRLVRIMAGEHRFEMLVPLAHEVETALLDPSIKIFGGDFVRPVEDLILRVKSLDRSFLHGNT